MRLGFGAVLLVAGVGVAQGGPVDEAGVAAEVSRRRLLELPGDELPVQELIGQLGDVRSDVVWRAASVLAHHGLAREEIAGLSDHEDPRIASLAVRSAGEAPLSELWRRREADPERRLEALWALEDLRGLTDGELLLALEDPETVVREAAQVLVTYERVPIEPGFLELVQGSPAARRGLLEALARKQRRDCDSWLLELWEGDSLELAERLWLIAALPEERLTPVMARVVLDAAGDRGHEVSDAAYRAGANLPSRLVDGLIGEVHRRCQGGADVETFLPHLVKASPDGDRHLLAVASDLGQEACESICTWLVGRGSPGLQERVRAALDGEIPLELHLLGRSADHLDRPERIQRVVAKLVAGDEEERLRAFDVLVRAEVYDDAMLDFALEDDGFWTNRVRQLTGLPGGRLPDEALLELLADKSTSNIVYACVAAAQRPLSPAVERVVLELGAGDHPEEVVAGVARALTAAGSEAAVREFWPRLRGNPDLQIDAVNWLAERGDPWVQALFLEELATIPDEAPGGPGSNSRGEASVPLFLQLALAKMGDRHLFEDLISNVSERSGWYLRQCRSFAVPRLNGDHVALIAEQLRLVDMPEAVRIELVSWLGMRPELGVHEILERLARSDDSEWVRMEALRGLLAGPRRGAIQAELFEVMDRPLDEENEELAYEIVGSAQPPLSDRDMELMVRLMVQLPLSRPREEARSDMSFYSPRAGFPMGVLAVQQLRRDPQARPGEVFAEVLEDVLADDGVGLLSRRRCLALLMQAVLDRRLREELGPPLSRLLLRIPEAEGAGMAHLLLGEEAEASGDLGAAADHYARSIRLVLRDPDPQHTLRVFLGDRDPVRGIHPLAALAARRHIVSARIAMASSDRDAAREQLKLAAELAAGDRETELEVLRLQEELNR